MKPRVLVVMGVSGSGKSTIGRSVAEHLGWAYEEGDSLHPAANIAKMAGGHPLTDADRAPWLGLVAAWIEHRLDAGASGVITCSALKRRYRDRLRAPGVTFVYLAGTRAQLLPRMQQRSGHFMPAALLDSQLADLEPPGPDEAVLTVDVDQPIDDQVAEIVTAIT